MRTRREFIVLLGGAAAVRRSSAQDRPARILYFTHSAGYRHDVISTSRDVLQRIGATADFQITMSEDVAVFTTENLLQYGGIMFFTTGELPLSDSQRRAFTDFIRAGGGFLGVHSATDTFYQWPEYRKIIGGGAPGAPAPSGGGVRARRGHRAVSGFGQADIDRQSRMTASGS